MYLALVQLCRRQVPGCSEEGCFRIIEFKLGRLKKDIHELNLCSYSNHQILHDKLIIKAHNETNTLQASNTCSMHKNPCNIYHTQYIYERIPAQLGPNLHQRMIWLFQHPPNSPWKYMPNTISSIYHKYVRWIKLRIHKFGLIFTQQSYLI